MTQFTASGEHFIYQADVEIALGRAAGLAFRMDDGRAGAIVAYDRTDRCLYLACPGTWNVEGCKIRRHVFHPPGKRFVLKVVVRGEHIEGYIDGQLLLTVVRYGLPAGRFGLYVDRAEVMFANVRARLLCVDQPQ